MKTTLSMSLRWRTFFLPKGGNRADELEDAAAAEPGNGLFAVADGASESICADVWAQLLVAAYIAGPPDVAAWQGWLAPVRRRWWDDVRARSLSWPAEHKLAEGASATLLGVQIQPAATWSAIAIGDSCLFQVRGGELIVEFPISRSDRFDNQPPLVATRAMPGEPEPLMIQGTWQPGDQFWLMTDALAQWFLKEAESQRAPGPQLEQLLESASPQAQSALIADWRQTRLLRNDDVALVRIET